MLTQAPEPCQPSLVSVSGVSDPISLVGISSVALGRAPVTEMELDDRFADSARPPAAQLVSRMHVRLLLAGAPEEWRVEHVSTNQGTSLQRGPAAKCFLRMGAPPTRLFDGDVLRLGDNIGQNYDTFSLILQGTG